LAVICDGLLDERKICPDEEGGCDEDGEQDGDEEAASEKWMKFTVSSKVDDALDKRLISPRSTSL
jgi:hypothetical protein